MRKLSEAEKAWLACLIDSEGCITISYCANTGPTRTNPQWQVRITIANTNVKLLETFTRITGMGNTYNTHAERYNKNAKKSYHTQIVRKQEVCELLTEILPFLIAKKSQARIAIRATAYAQTNDLRMEILRQKIHALNAKRDKRR